MRTQNLILSLLAALITGALLILLAKVRQDGADAAPSEDQLAEALRRHQSWKGTSGSGETRALSSSLTVPAPRPGGSGRRGSSFEPRADSPAADLATDRAAPGGAAPRSLGERMDEANQLYDRREFEAAIERAREVLAEAPGNVRMLRVIVSSACMMGDAEMALRSYGELPERDQQQMRVRCERYGIDLPLATQ